LNIFLKNWRKKLKRKRKEYFKSSFSIDEIPFRVDSQIALYITISQLCVMGTENCNKKIPEDILVKSS